MNEKKERFMGTHKRNAVAGALMLLIAGNGGIALKGSATQAQAANAEKQMTTPSKFYCNAKALTSEERAHHKQLSEKGYEFRFRPQDVTLAELAGWVAAESKCCPFFDFHIDLEDEGKLICLRLTGEEGEKKFMRTEFGLK